MQNAAFVKIQRFTTMNTSIWLLMIVFCMDTEAYNANEVASILKHLSDCKFNSVKVQNGDLITSKAVMKNGLLLALNTLNTENIPILTLDDHLPIHNYTYYTRFKLCQNVLVANTDTEKLTEVLSKSDISVNAGIFRYSLDNFGNVTEWIEFYKTNSTSNRLQINIQSELDQEKYIWKRRSNLLGVNFEAISS